MQSYAREYLGKNQFWTPSSIGLTNSLIDNKLNNLDEIDTSGLLSKKEAEDTYTTKTLLNEKINEINYNLENNYYKIDNINTLHNQMMGVIDNFFLTKNTAEDTYLKITDYSPPNITYNHSFIYQTDEKYYEGNVYINGIKAGASGSVLEVNIPENINGDLIYISLNFRIKSNFECKEEMKKIYVKLMDSQTSNNGSIFQSIQTSEDYIYFSIKDFFVGLSNRKIYLKFGFNYPYEITKTDSDMKNKFTIPYTSYSPNMEITAVGFN